MPCETYLGFNIMIDDANGLLKIDRSRSVTTILEKLAMSDSKPARTSEPTDKIDLHAKLLAEEYPFE